MVGDFVFEGCGNSAQRRMKTGAEDGVNQQLRIVGAAFKHGTGQILFGGDGDQALHELSRQLLVGTSRLRLQIFRLGQQNDANLPAGGIEMTRRHQAIAAVVAFSAEHQDVFLRRKFARHKLGDAGACGLHQALPGDAHALDGAFIALAHFGCGQNIHVAVVREGL